MYIKIRIRESRFFIGVLLALFVTCSYCVDARAIEQKTFIDMKLNGQYIKMNVDAYEKNHRIMASARAIGEALNATVEWVKNDRKILIIRSGKTIELILDSRRAVVNGEATELDIAAEIVDNRTMVPVRFIAESLGCSVDWDLKTYSILLSKPDLEIQAEKILTKKYSEDDLLWLERIIEVEGRGLSLEGKLAIANVVKNRKESSLYPDSIYGVIFDREYCIQFPPAFKSGFKEVLPSQESIIAAKMALEGINNIEGCLFFNNIPFSNKKNDFYKEIEGEYFYY